MSVKSHIVYMYVYVCNMYVRVCMLYVCELNENRSSSSLKPYEVVDWVDVAEIGLRQDNGNRSQASTCYKF